MTKKNILFLLFVVLSSMLWAQRPINYSSRQMTFAVQGGMSYNTVSRIMNDRAKIGVRAGLTMEKHLAQSYYFQTSLLFVSKGFSTGEPQAWELDLNGYYLELPALLLFKFGGVTSNKGMFIGLGPYVSYGMFGKSSKKTFYQGENKKETFNSFGDKANTLERADIGMQIGLGYDFSARMQFSAYYSMGLNRATSSVTVYKWRGAYACLSVFF